MTSTNRIYELIALTVMLSACDGVIDSANLTPGSVSQTGGNLGIVASAGAIGSSLGGGAGTNAMSGTTAGGGAGPGLAVGGGAGSGNVGGNAASCTAPQMQCAGTCKDFTKDAANCGACGQVCPSGQACQGGQCGCDAGRSRCGAACVDLGSDGANCGACGKACSGSEVSCNIRAENNVFKSIQSVFYFGNDDDDAAIAESIGNSFSSSSGTSDRGSSFKPPYSYALESTSSLEASIREPHSDHVRWRSARGSDRQQACAKSPATARRRRRPSRACNGLDN